MNTPHPTPTEDLTSDLGPPTSALPSATLDLEGEFIRPAYQFNGAPLWPYTEGVDLVLRQINHPEDNGLTRALKFIFVLCRRGGKTMEEDFARHIIPLAWQGAENIHLALFLWGQANVKTEADQLAALKLYDEIRQAAVRGAVEIVPRLGGKKKAAAKRSRPKSRSSFPSSPAIAETS